MKNYMQKIILIISIVAGMCSICSADYLEQFNGGTAGTTVGRIHGTSVDPGTVTWHSTGGNPGGYVSVPVGTSDDRLYWLAMSNPSIYNSELGHMLKVDLYITGTITGPDDPLIRFFINGTAFPSYYMTTDAASFSYTGNTGWFTYSVILSPDNFMPEPSFTNSLTFEQVIANPGAIGLSFTDSGDINSMPPRGFSSTDGAIIRVDNFGTVVPEPASLILFAGAAAGLIAKRRLRKKV